MKRLVSILLAVTIVSVILILTALILIPDDLERFWQAIGLPTQPLHSVQSRLGVATGTGLSDLRLYGILETEEVQVMSEISGRITGVQVQKGAWIEEGSELVVLDDTIAKADLAAADRAIAAARAAREAAAAPPDPTVIEVANGLVMAAEAEVKNAKRSLELAGDFLAQPLELEAQINQMVALIPAGEAAVSRAQAGEKQAQILLEEALRDGSQRGQYMQEFYSYQVAAAKEEVKAAEARLQGLRRSLAHLRSMRAQPLQLQANLHQAESGVALAEAGRDLADAERARVVAAPSEESVAVADARVSQSEAARALVLWHVQRHTISAPSSGQVLDVLIEPGELAMVGVPLLTLADVSKMVVRVYVSSADLHRITLGESLAVEVSGVPGQQLAGEVVYVAEKAQFRPNNVLNPEDRGDMVFLVKVRIANPDNALKPGMPADILLPKPSSSTGF